MPISPELEKGLVIFFVGKSAKKGCWKYPYLPWPDNTVAAQWAYWQYPASFWTSMNCITNGEWTIK